METIKIVKTENQLILKYTTEQLENDWVRRTLKEEGEVTIKRFYFETSDLLYEQDLQNFDDEDNEVLPIEFILGKREGDYFKIKKKVFSTNNDFYFHNSLKLTRKHFIAETKISILGLIDSLVRENVKIGGNPDVDEVFMPFELYEEMIKNFPTTHEKSLYSQARVASIIKNFFYSTVDAEFKFQKYLNKKTTRVGENLTKLFHDYELSKYKTIQDKLKIMLKNEVGYSEDQWQNEILEIILLLYPKYIYATKTVHIPIDGKKRRYLDFMLIDSNGHIDVIEIKKPFSKAIMTETLYRNNFTPHRDLIGTVMQIEKYLFYLNRYGTRGEKELTKKYREKLPEDLSLKIINPKGFIIMGRANNLSSEQLLDFEVAKRQYKNIIDVITYDDLLQRLSFTIAQIQKL
ncbi:Shedu immune nuclease family protein [Chryseobacterium indologenes]|uniref:Shedu immune nuclease family protein n=1 Tax=Chryseobacterium indologenes TaxID=253 RepID=UPI003019E0BE